MVENWFFLLQFRNKTRISACITSIQYCTGVSSQSKKFLKIQITMEKGNIYFYLQMT
jgi:hypothetical protein